MLLHGRLRRRGEFWVSEHEPLGGEGAPVHTVGLVPVHPATEGLSAGRLRALVWDARGRFLLTPGAAAGEAARGRGAAGARGRARGRALPGQRGGRERERATGWRSRSCSCSSSPSPGAGVPRAARAQARSLAARGVVVDRWRWSLPFELTGDQKTRDGGDGRGPRTRAPDAAAADGRGGRGQDRGGAPRDAPGGGERRPGGADGADRDARGAAPPHARPAARRRDPARAAHGLHPGRAAGATCSARSAAARSSWWSARTP